MNVRFYLPDLKRIIFLLTLVFVGMVSYAQTVTSVTATPNTGSFNAGDVITIRVNFSEAMDIDVPAVITLTLETGTTDAVLTYGGTDQTNVMFMDFTYTVAGGETAADLDYAATSSLVVPNNAIEVNAAPGNTDLDPTLPAVGSANSLAGGASLIIDTSAPATPSVPNLDATSDSGSSNSDDITNDDTPLITGTAEAGSTVTITSNISGVVGTGTATGGNYSITLSALTGVAHTLTATATDAAGNTSTASAGATITIDLAAPATPSNPDLTAGSDTGSSNTDNYTEDDTPTISGTGDNGSVVVLTSDISGNVGSVTVAGGTYSITTSTLPAGSHVITATASDAAGNSVNAASTLSITVDTSDPSQPAIPDLAAADDLGSSNSDNITSAVNDQNFSGTAEANASIQIRDNTTPLGTTTADGSGNWTIELDLAAGSYAINVIATDLAGNASTASSSLSLTIDDTDPAAPSVPDLDAGSDTGSSNSDNITNDQTPTVTGTAESGATVVITSDIDGVVGTGVATGGNYSITLSTLSAGPHDLVATATDVAGNEGIDSAPLEIEIDITAPAAPGAPVLAAGSDTGSSNSDEYTSDTTPEVSGTGVDGTTITLISNVNGSVGSVAVASSSYTITASALSTGNQTLTATATDAAGNTSTASAGLAITIDTSAPATPGTPDLDAADDSGSSNTDNITNIITDQDFSGTTEANASVEIFDNVASLGTTTADGTGAWSIALNLGAGTYAINIRSTDLAGNVSSASSSASFVVDVSAPAAPSIPNLDAGSDSGPSSTDDYTNDTTPTFTGTAESGSTVTIISDQNGTVGTGTATGGNYSITTSALNAVAHSITATATDAAGNTSTASSGLSLTIDTSAPAAPGTPDMTAGTDSGSSSTDNLTNDNTPTFTGTGVNGTLITLLRNGVTNLGTFTVAAGAWSITASTIADGAATITATATDQAGNTSTASGGLSITIDTGAPSAPAGLDLASADDTGSSNADNITKNTTGLTISGTAEINASIEVFRAGTTSLGTTTADGTGNWSLDITLTEAVHTITAQATDASGNTSTASTGLGITVDVTAPAGTPATPNLDAASDSGPSNTDNTTNDATAEFDFSNVGALANTRINIYSSIDGLIGFVTLNGSGGAANAPTTLLTDGTHSITARAADVAGNEGTVSTGLNVTLDRVAPTIIGSAFEANGTNDDIIYLNLSETLGIANSTTPSLNSDAAPGAGFSVSINNAFDNTNNSDGGSRYESATPRIRLQSDGNNKWSSTTTVSYATGGNIYDLAGNELGTINNLPINDNQAPLLTSGFVFNPNGTGAEIITVFLSEGLSLPSGPVTGFSVNSLNPIASQVYSNVNNSVTLTAGFNGAWTDAVLVSYSQAGGNVTDPATNELASFTNTPIRFVNINVQSNNANGYTQKAKAGDIVTVSFATNATLNETPYVEIDGVEANVSGGPVNFSATLLTTAGNNTGVMSILVSGKTAADSTGTAYTTNSSQVEFDKTSPSITPVSIISNNALNTALAKPGDNVTLSFTVSEALAATPTVTIAGRAATVNNVGLNYTAVVTMNGTDPEGAITFNIDLQDQVGNTANATATTNASAVTYDRTLPTVTSIVVPPLPGNTALNGIGSTNGTTASTITYEVTFDANVANVDVNDFSLTPLGDVSAFDSYPAVNGSILSVTGGPQVYTVTVNNVTGTGQLRLNLASNGTIRDASGNFNAASFTTGQTYTKVLTAPTDNVASPYAFPFNTTSIEIGWNNPNPGFTPTHYLIRVKGPDADDVPGNYHAVAPGGYVNNDLDFSDGNGAINLSAGSAGSFQFYQFTTLLSGKSYDFQVIPYNLSPNTTNDNINFYTVGTQTLTGATPAAAVGTFTALDVAPAEISSLTTAFGTDINFRFQVNEDGGNLTADNAKLRFSQLTFVPFSGAGGNTVLNWHDVIAEAQLSDNEGNTITTTNITASSIIFATTSGDDEIGEVDDNEQKVYSLSIRFKNTMTGTSPTLIDNRRFEFQVLASSFTYAAGSSQITGTASVNSDPNFFNINNRVDVDATELNFSVQPPDDALVLTNLTTTPVVRATDANGNTDLNFNGTNIASIQNADLIPMSSNLLSAVNGVLTFPGTLQYFDDGDGTLTVSSAGLTDGVSEPVNVQYENTNTIIPGPIGEPEFFNSLLTYDYAQLPFDFTIVDDGGAGGDGSDTRITQIVISQGPGNTVTNWSDALAGAILWYPGVAFPYIQGTVGTNTITFSTFNTASGGTGHIADNASKTYQLYVWLKPTLGGSLRTSIDGLNFVFQVNDEDITTAAQSSTFTGTETENSTSDHDANPITPNRLNNEVQVLAEKFVFMTNPADELLVDTDISAQPPVPTVEATDYYNNRDLDYNSTDLAVSNADNLPMSNGPAASSMVNGLLTFNNAFQFNAIGDGTLTVSSAASGFAAVSEDVLVRVAKSATITLGSDPEPGTISSLEVASPGVQVFDFTITDDAGTEDDGTPMQMTSITINASGDNEVTDFSKVIGGATLYDGATTINVTTINPTSLVFDVTGAIGYIGDEDSKHYRLSIWLQSPMDNIANNTIDHQNFAFIVDEASIVTDPNGSSIIDGETEESGPAANEVIVVPTKLEFTSVPPAGYNASINTNIPNPVGPIVVEAVDIYGNRDLDFTGSITAFSNDGNLNMDNEPTTETFAGGTDGNGVFTFASNFQYTQDGDGTLNMTAGGLTGVSPTITVISSFQSQIKGDPTFVFQDNIPYISHQETDLTQAGSFELARMLLSDGDADGVAGDIDGASTVLSTLTIGVTNHSHIRRIALFKGATEVAELDGNAYLLVGGLAQYTFTSLQSELIAPDDGTVAISLRASFENNATDIIDNTLIQVSVKGATLAGGSQFRNDPGDIAGVTNGLTAPTDKNFIEVVASKYIFTTSPATYEGVLQPTTLATLNAVDANNIVDFDYDNITPDINSTAGTNAAVQNFVFIDGVLPLTGLMYTNFGNGTLTASTAGIVSGVSTTVNVINAEVEQLTQGVEMSTTLSGGYNNRAVLGFQLTPQNFTSGQPVLNAVTVDFGNNITGVFQNIRLYRSTDQTFSLAQGDAIVVTAPNPTVTPTNSVTFTLPGTETLDVAKRYFVVVDVSTLAGGNSGAITPTLHLDLGAAPIGIQVSNGSVTTAGFNRPDVAGLTYTFEDLTAPQVVSLTPANNSINVPLATNFVITFNEPVVSLDNKISLFLGNGTFLQDLTNPVISDGGKTFTFDFPGDLQSDTRYIVKIRPGNIATGEGFVDLFNNVFAGFTSNSQWTFRSSDNTPPVFPVAPEVVGVFDIGFDIRVQLDEPGTVHYLVVPDPSAAPTNDQIRGVTAYGGALASGTINVIRENEWHHASIFDFPSNQDFTVWVIAQDAAQPTPNQMATPVSIDESTPNSSPAGVMVMAPNTDFCIGGYQPLTAPIHIIEGVNGDFAAGTNQSFNLTLPSGFEFNTAAVGDTVYRVAGNNISNPITLTYLNKTTLRFTYTVSGTNERDKITIANLQIKATGAINTNGNILRLGGSANQNGNSEDDNVSHGALNTVGAFVPANFTTVPAQATITYKPSQGEVKVVLVPSVIEEVTNLFNGPGVFQDTLYASIAGYGQHTIGLTVTDQFGCVSSTTRDIRIIDNAITGLQNSFCINDGVAVIASNDPQNFRVLTNLTYRLPNTIAQIQVPQVGADFHFDPATINLGTNPFITIEFTGTYQSTVDLTQTSTVLQSVNVVALPVASLRFNVPGPLEGREDEYCSNNGTLQLTGGPIPNAQEDGEFQILVGGVVQSNTNFGLIDNGDGTATLDLDAAADELGGFGLVTLRYRFTNSAGCVDDADEEITINPAPQAAFARDRACENISAPFISTSSVPSTSGTSIIRWSWNFDDGEASQIESPEHTFQTIGNFDVELTVTTDAGCQHTFVRGVNVGDIPEVSFTMTGTHQDEDVAFTGTVAPLIGGSTIQTTVWDFGDTQNATGLAANHRYTNAGEYKARLTVTSSLQCQNIAERDIVIVPFINVDNTVNFTYAENFEGTISNDRMIDGWIAPLFNNPSWRIGSASKDPDGNDNPATEVPFDDNINMTARNGNNVWITNPSGPYRAGENSYVYSPMFDISELDRPIVFFDSYTDTDANDGVVLQYSVDNKNIGDATKVWTLLGTNGSGVAWYNKRDVTANPGEQSAFNYGWTENIDTLWRESKHSLGVVQGASRIMFRFAFATNQTASGLSKQDGFAFDNFRIGNGTRTVLVENFTNTAGDDVVKFENDSLRQFDGDGVTLVKINYHVAFPGEDPFNEMNPADPGARALYYGVSSINQTRLDGVRPSDATTLPFSNWGPRALSEQSLKLAEANINIQAEVQDDGSLMVQGSFTPTVEINSNAILHVAIVEQNVLLDENPILNGRINTGETEFEYVLRKMLPNAAGTKYSGSQLTKDIQVNFGPYHWSTNQFLEGPNDLAVIVFLQDEDERFIYQSQIVRDIDDPGVVTGIENLDKYFNVYPNPADKEMTVELPEAFMTDTDLQMFDQLGKVVERSTFAKGHTSKTINTSSLAGGVYLIQINTEKGILRRKVMVLHNH